jgi:hypothetical protein
MTSKTHETAKKLATLLQTTFASSRIELEIYHDDYPEPDSYRVWGIIDLGEFSFPINAELFSLCISLGWIKHSEFIDAHQWIGPRTKRRKPTYRKISRFWEMVERLEALGYTRGDYDENPFNFVMMLNHPTPVLIDPPEAQEALISIIRQTITILKEENPWAMEG